LVSPTKVEKTFRVSAEVRLNGGDVDSAMTLGTVSSGSAKGLGPTGAATSDTMAYAHVPSPQRGRKIRMRGEVHGTCAIVYGQWLCNRL